MLYESRVKQERRMSATTSFPSSRVKQIAKLDSDVGNVSKEALYLLGSAADALVAALAREASRSAVLDGRKKLSERDVGTAIHGSPQLDFMQLDFSL